MTTSSRNSDFIYLLQFSLLHSQNRLTVLTFSFYKAGLTPVNTWSPCLKMFAISLVVSSVSSCEESELHQFVFHHLSQIIIAQLQMWRPEFANCSINCLLNTSSRAVIEKFVVWDVAHCAIRSNHKLPSSVNSLKNGVKINCTQQ